MNYSFQITFPPCMLGVILPGRRKENFRTCGGEEMPPFSKHMWNPAVIFSPQASKVRVLSVGKKPTLWKKFTLLSYPSREPNRRYTGMEFLFFFKKYIDLQITTTVLRSRYYTEFGIERRKVTLGQVAGSNVNTTKHEHKHDNNDPWPMWKVKANKLDKDWLPSNFAVFYHKPEDVAYIHIFKSVFFLSFGEADAQDWSFSSEVGEGRVSWKLILSLFCF